MRSNRKYFIALIAGITAAVGVIVAIGVYLKKKASIIGEQLDFDPDMYDDEDYFDAEENLEEEPVEPAAEQAIAEPTNDTSFDNLEETDKTGV